MSMTKQQQGWLFAAIVSGLVMIVLCCAAAIFGFRWLMNDEPSKAVDSYLKAVHQRDEARAKELVCQEQRNATYKGKFLLLAMFSEVVDWDIAYSSIHGRSAEVLAHVFTREQGNSKLIFVLSEEDDQWRVCNVDLSLS